MLNFCGTQLCIVNQIKLLGVTFTSDLSWSVHVTSLAKRASRLLGMLRRAQWILPQSGKVTAYKAFVRPLMEYASPVWSGGASSALQLLDKIQNRAISIFDITNPVNLCIQPLFHRRNVASLCVFYKFFNQPATSELKMLIPGLATRPRCTRLTSALHRFALEFRKSRTSSHLRSFIPCIGRLWNELLQNVFPAEFNMQLFKSSINQFLMQR